MTSDEAAASDDGIASEARPLPFDITTAHQARMYDYVLGGKDNYAADRAASDGWLKIDPESAFGARANRAFLGRMIRYLTAEAGIRQFLDIGTGIPTAGNTHQVAQATAPESRVVYVDYDPVVLAHARALLTSHKAGATDYIDADLRDTGTILSRASRLLDFSKPVAVTLLAILHVIPDSDDPYGIVATLMDRMPSGSYLAISHGGSDLLDPDRLAAINDVVNRMVKQTFTYRSREQIARFFQGLDLVAPGLVRVEEWHPDPRAEQGPKTSAWCAVGRKP
jgi:S-adenosyl methyltransferase